MTENEPINALANQAAPSEAELLDAVRAKDLDCLASQSSQSLPSLAQTAQWLEQASDREAKRKSAGFGRPLQVLLAVGIAVSLLLGVPLPYERTIGYEVQLSASGDELPRAKIAELTAEWGKALHAQKIHAYLTKAGEPEDFADPQRAALLSEQYTLRAEVDGSMRQQVDDVTAAFVEALRSHDIQAQAQIRARTEPRWGSAYAMVANNLNVSLKPKASPKQLQASIESKLTQAGVIRPKEIVPAKNESPPQALPEPSKRLLRKKPKLPPVQESILPEPPEDNADPPFYIIQLERRALSDEQLADRLQTQLRHYGLRSKIRVQNGRIVDLTVTNWNEPPPAGSPP
jgi:hypothetical protein